MTKLAPGTTVGDDYIVERALSEGGMGAVYVAMQRSTGVLRAVKTMHGELLGDERLRARFEEEARLAATIPSAHVVKVLGAGWDARLGLPWLAMELLPGKPLTTLLEKNAPFSPALTEKILEQACHGLGAAAALGIIHRDVKPDNLFVSPSTTVGLPFVLKVLDFGIAKQTLGGGPKSTQVVGTPFWLSPEQTDPRPRISPATDVWPLGLVAFACLTGKMFWGTAYEPDASMQAFLRELVIDAIPPATERARERGAEVPAWFDAWFARCVHRDPSARFMNANEAFTAFVDARRDAGDTSTVSGSENARLVASLSASPVATIAASPLGSPPPKPQTDTPSTAYATPHGNAPHATPRETLLASSEKTELVPERARAAAPNAGSRLWIALPATLLGVAALVAAIKSGKSNDTPSPETPATSASSKPVSYALAASAAMAAQDPSAPISSAAPVASASATPSAEPSADLGSLNKPKVAAVVDPIAGTYSRCTVGRPPGSQRLLQPLGSPCTLVRNGASYTLNMSKKYSYFTGTFTPAGETLMKYNGVYMDPSDPTANMLAAGSLLKQPNGWFLPATNLTPTLTLVR